MTTKSSSLITPSPFSEEPGVNNRPGRGIEAVLSLTYIAIICVADTITLMCEVKNGLRVI